MLRLLGKIPFNVAVACSGGADSMAALNFVQSGNRAATVLYFNHGTEFGRLSESFIKDYCADHNLQLKIGQLSSSKDKKESWEEYWRNQRYKWFESFDLPIVMAHHLNDQMENWIFTSAHGNPKLIPYSNKNIIRPFLLNLKSQMVDWCTNRQVPWLEDASNQDTKFMRNKIRKNILPQFLELNPGFDKVIRKKVSLLPVV